MLLCIQYKMKTLILLAAIFAIGACTSNLNSDEAQVSENRIVNGIEATTTDMPYQVGLLVKGINTTSGARCGGALISKRVVLTAAHCFNNKQLAGHAYLGSNRYRKGLKVAFSRVSVHENYNATTFENDIALVHLEKSVTPNGRTIKIIPLNKNYLEDNTEITVSGFGLIGAGVSTDKLFYTQMTIQNKKVCSIFNVPIVDGMACAKGVDGKETCSGDSGGPVVRNWPKHPTHVALVSFGAGCQKDKPKVFTRTASYIDWIEKNMIR